MPKNFPLIEYRLGHAALKSLPNRQRNQLVGCMHAHNELAFLNRLSLFVTNDFGDGPIHDDAHSVQMWTAMQLLVGKLYETWAMIDARFLGAVPQDAALASLSQEHRECLEWLIAHFGADLKDSLLRMIRDRSAFHYHKLNLEDAVENLRDGDNVVYLAQHAINTNYFMGSALVFRTMFLMLADVAGIDAALPPAEREQKGVEHALDQISEVNAKIARLLYGLIKHLLEEATGAGLEAMDHVRSEVQGAPQPERIVLPAFVNRDAV